MNGLMEAAGECDALAIAVIALVDDHGMILQKMAHEGLRDHPAWEELMDMFFTTSSRLS